MASDTQIITRKVQLIPVGDKEAVNHAYKWIRDGMHDQNRAANMYITALYMEALQKKSDKDAKELSNEGKEEFHRLVTELNSVSKELNRFYGRIGESKKGSAYPLEFTFGKGSAAQSSM